MGRVRGAGLGLALALIGAGAVPGETVYEALAGTLEGVGLPARELREVASTRDPAARARLDPVRESLREYERTLTRRVRLAREDMQASLARERNAFVADPADAAVALPRAEAMHALLEPARFLADYHWFLGDPLEGLRFLLRRLRLGADLVAAANTATHLDAGLFELHDGLRAVTWALLEGRLPAKKTQVAAKMVKLLLDALPSRADAPRLVGRVREGYLAGVRRAVDAGRVDGALATRLEAALATHGREAVAALTAGTFAAAATRIAAATRALVDDNPDLVRAFPDAPTFARLPDNLARFEAARALVLAALRAAVFRSARDAWPLPEEIAPRLPPDPLGTGTVRYRLERGAPLLGAAGADGTFEGFVLPHDFVLAPRDADRELRAVGGFATRWSAVKARTLRLPVRQAYDVVPAPAGCPAARRDLAARAGALARDFELDLLPDVGSVLSLLVANGRLAEVPRCPRWGLWYVHPGGWGCSIHPEGSAAEVPEAIRDEWKGLCAGLRRALEGALRTYDVATNSSLFEVGDAAREALTDGGYLARAAGCPVGGAWSREVATGGVTCAAHP